MFLPYRLEKIQKIQLLHHLKPKQDGKGLRKRENKDYRSVSFHPEERGKIKKKQQKKLKNTITASFQAKIGWKMLRKIENKNYPYISFLPDGQEKFQKNSTKVQKIEKIPLRLHSKPKQVRKFRESEKIKIIASFRCFPKGKRKLHKNSKNFQKIKKYHYGCISWKNRLGRAEKGRK